MECISSTLLFHSTFIIFSILNLFLVALLLRHALFEAKIVIVITRAPLKMHLLNHTPLFWHLLHLPFLLQRLAFVLALKLDVMFALVEESYL